MLRDLSALWATSNATSWMCPRGLIGLSTRVCYCSFLFIPLNNNNKSFFHISTAEVDARDLETMYIMLTCTMRRDQSLPLYAHKAHMHSSSAQPNCTVLNDFPPFPPPLFPNNSEHRELLHVRLAVLHGYTGSSAVPQSCNTGRKPPHSLPFLNCF